MITLAWDCCEWHDSGGGDLYSHTRKDALAAERRLAKRGEVDYHDVHLIARLRLGLLSDAHAACDSCGITDRHALLQAALNWPAVPDGRLRQNERGFIYSASPDDYRPLCYACHRQLDSWRTALKLRESAAAIQKRQVRGGNGE